MDERELLDLGIRPVALIPAKTPQAMPDRCDAWYGEKDRDTVLFLCLKPFELRFEKGRSPFDEETIVGEESNGIYRAKVQLREAVTDGDYRYTIDIGGETADPEIVVRKDPR